MSTTTARMDVINTPLDAQEACRFQVINQKLVGYIDEMSFSNGAVLKEKFSIPDPENPNKLLDVVGVLDHICWSGDPTQPVIFKGRVLYKNRGTLKTCLLARDNAPDITISWTVKAYDATEKKYYKMFHAKDIIMRLTYGTKPVVSETKSTDIGSYDTFYFEFEATGKSGPKEQLAQCASSCDLKFQEKLSTMTS